MQPCIMEKSATKFPWLDSVLVAAQRVLAALMKGKLGGTAARDPFNSMPLGKPPKPTLSWSVG